MKRILVGDIHANHADAFRTVVETTPLEVVVRSFAANASIQIAFVVQGSGLFKGAIARKDLLDWVAIKVVGGEPARRMNVGNMRSILFSATAGELMRKASVTPTVTESTDMETALKLMMDSGEPVLPVIDKTGQLIGDLRVSEVLSAVLDFKDSQEIEERDKSSAR